MQGTKKRIAALPVFRLQTNGLQQGRCTATCLSLARLRVDFEQALTALRHSAHTLPPQSVIKARHSNAAAGVKAKTGLVARLLKDTLAKKLCWSEYLQVTDNTNMHACHCVFSAYACVDGFISFYSRISTMTNSLKASLVARSTIAVMLALGAYAAQAQTSASSICADGKQDPAACQREVGATRNKAPIDPNQDFASNALKRCKVYANDPEARQSCEDRVRNQNTRRDGSVFGGGTIQEHRTIQTTPAPRPVQ